MNIYSDAIEQLGIFTIVGGILAIVATVLAYVFIVPEKRREKLNAFGKFLHDTCNFRLVYELLMMAVLLLKNVISINNKLRSQNGNEEKNGIFMAPDMGDLRQQLRSKAAQPQNPQPQVPQSAPVAKFCGKCGSPLNEAGKCPNCDNNQPQA